MKRTTNQRTALIADDNPDVLGVLEQILRRSGFEVTTAQSGLEALALFQVRGSWSLVVLDVDMGSGPTGLDVLCAIRATHPDLPVLVMSGNGSYKQAAEEANAQFQPKPFFGGELKALLADLVK